MWRNRGIQEIKFKNIVTNKQSTGASNINKMNGQFEKNKFCVVTMCASLNRVTKIIKNSGEVCSKDNDQDKEQNKEKDNVQNKVQVQDMDQDMDLDKGQN